MTEKVKFSSTHGENITLSNCSATATWSPKQIDGWVSSFKPLQQGQTVVVEFNGSGHCELGIFKHDPACANPTKQTFKKINEIRIHKKKCTIPVTLNDRGTEVSSRFQEKTFTTPLEQGSKSWLTTFVRFGKVSVRLLLNGSPDNCIKFSNHHGSNISLEENDCIASTVMLSPSSSCFVKEKMIIGEELVFQCTPIIDGDREPSRFHVKLDVYDRHPESLKKDFKHLFDSGPVCSREPPTTTLEVFAKDDCKGQIAVSLQNSTTVGYRSASKKYNEQHLRVASDGIWIILELYRTCVTVSKNSSSKSNVGTDVVDAAVREPLNVDAENSMDPFLSHQERTQLKRQESDYSEVTGVKTIVDNSTDSRLAALERGQTLMHKQFEELTQQLKPALVCSNAPLSPLSGKGTMCMSNDVHVKTCSNFKDREIDIRGNFTKLIKDIDCVPLSDKLWEKMIITLNEYQEITSETTEEARNRKLLRTIDRKRVLKSTMDVILDNIEQGHLKDFL